MWRNIECKYGCISFQTIQHGKASTKCPVRDKLLLGRNVWFGHLTKAPVKIENNVCARVTNCFSSHGRVILLRRNSGNKHQNNTRVSVGIVRHESTCIILFHTRHNESINDDKNDDLYSSSPCLTRSILILLMTSQPIADDVTMTRQLWRDHANNDI